MVACIIAKITIIGFTRCLAGGPAGQGIKLKVIAPGIFNTD